MPVRQIAIGSVAMLIATAALAEPEIALRAGNELMNRHATPRMAEALDDRPPIGAIEELEANTRVTIFSAGGGRRSAQLGEPIYEGDRVAVSAGRVAIATINGQSIALDGGVTKTFRSSEFPIENSRAGGVELLRRLFVYTSGLIGREEVPANEPRDYGPVGSLGIRG